jgi:hypothetical protein
LNVHHIEYSKDYKYAWEYPDNKLTTLCSKCHKDIHDKEMKMESYGMHRTTEGIRWVFSFTGNELQMLMVLLELEDLKSGIVVLSSLVRKNLAKEFDKTDRYIRGLIKSLEDKDGLVKLSPNDILLNPSLFYKGGTKSFKGKYDKYLLAKRNITTNIENFENERKINSPRANT